MPIKLENVGIAVRDLEVHAMHGDVSPVLIYFAHSLEADLSHVPAWTVMVGRAGPSCDPELQPQRRA